MKAKHILILSIAIVAIAGGIAFSESSPDLNGRCFWCYPPWDERFVSVITPKAMDSSPNWNDTEPNPPLSARKAMALAEQKVSVILKDRTVPPEYARELDSIKLIPLKDKKWCWEVRYGWHRRTGGMTGSPMNLCVYVLMNGEAVQPQAEKWTRGVEEEDSKE